MIDGSKRGLMQVKDVRNFLDSVLDEDIHTKRIASLANATLGVMTGASLGVAVIGKSLAQARGLLPKHAVKQVDRLLSNPRIEAWDIFASWVPEMVGPRKDIVVADFDADGHLALKLVMAAADLAQRSQGRAVRNAYEDAAVRRLAEVLPDDVKVTLLAGFADTKLFGFLDELGFDYVIRLRGNTKVSAGRPVRGPGRSGAQAAPCHRGAVPGRRRRVRAGQGHEGSLVSGGEQRCCILTADHRPLFKTLGRGAELPRYQGSALRPRQPASATRNGAAAAQCVRWRSAHPARCRRREPRHDLKSNTVNTHSLFRQGCMLYDLIPNMPEHRLRPLVEQYAEILQQSRVVTETFAIV